MKAKTPTIDAMTRVASPQIHPKPNGRFILKPPCCHALILGSTCEGPMEKMRAGDGRSAEASGYLRIASKCNLIRHVALPTFEKPRHRWGNILLKRPAHHLDELVCLIEFRRPIQGNDSVIV